MLDHACDEQQSSQGQVDETGGVLPTADRGPSRRLPIVEKTLPLADLVAGVVIVPLSTGEVARAQLKAELGQRDGR